MRTKFHEVFGEGPEPIAFRAPGRVNLIGEHTDYNGGHVFPCALSVSIVALARPRQDSRVRLYSMNFPSENSKPVEANLVGLAYLKERGWANYPLGVLHMLELETGKLPGGFDLLYNGNLPNGAGLSSSAAIEVLTARVANDIFNLGLDGVKIAQIAQRAESEFVGMRCGIMDQFASSMGKREHALLLDCSTLAYEHVPLKLEGCCIVLANSNKPHELSNSGYNDRRRECEEALADIQTVKSDVKALCALSEAEFADVKNVIKNPLALKRARHQVTEEARTLKAAAELRAGNLKAFGQLMNASHVSLRDDFEVSCDELDVLAELAWKQPGVLGSRMTGGGFGGCTVSLVELSAVDAFKRDIGAAYTAKTGRVADFYVVQTADGAAKLELDKLD